MENYVEACELLQCCYHRFQYQWKPVMKLDAYYDFIHALSAGSSGSHSEALTHANAAISKDEWIRDAIDGNVRNSTAEEKTYYKNLMWLGPQSATTRMVRQACFFGALRPL